MRMGEACHLIANARGENVIVATMGAMFAFDALNVTERRLSSVPLMGGAASLGLGLALARSSVGVIVVDGDASLLMQLGGLVTVAESGPTQFVHFVVENGVQFAGASNLPTPGAACVTTRPWREPPDTVVRIGSIAQRNWPTPCRNC